MLVDVQLDGVEGTWSLADVEDLIRVGRIGPETPVRADTLTGGRWVPAGDLEIYRGLADAPERLVRRAWNDPGIPWFTALLIGLEIRMFLWVEPGATGMRAFELLSRDVPAIREGRELWRLVTYSLLHADAEHIGANLVLLAWVGIALEGVLGGVHLAGLYLVSVFCGGLLGALGDGPASIGASGGDFGFFAAAVVFGMRYGELLPRRARPRFGALLGLYAAWVLVNGLVFGERVDNMGHLGGALGGGLYALLSRPAVTPAWRRQNRMVAIGSLVAMLAAGVAIAVWPTPMTALEEDGLSTNRPAYWQVGWTATGDRGWASTVTDSTLSVRATKGDALPTVAAGVEGVLADYRTVDPTAKILEQGPMGAGERVVVAWNLNGAERRTDALVLTQGRMSWRVAIEAAPGSRDLAYADRIFSDVQLGIPDDLEQALRPAVTWRDRVRRAEALDVLGRSDEAAVELAAAEKEAANATTARALVEHLGRYPSAGAADRIVAAVETWPTDTELRVAAVRALSRIGDARGLTVLDAGIVLRPDARALLELRAELYPEAPKGIAGAEGG